MRRGQLIVLVNGDNHMLKERCSCMIIVVTCFICRNWFRSHQGMMRERESCGSYGDWHFGVRVCVTCDIKQNSQKSE